MSRKFIKIAKEYCKMCDLVKHLGKDLSYREGRLDEILDVIARLKTSMTLAVSDLKKAEDVVIRAKSALATLERQYGDFERLREDSDNALAEIKREHANAAERQALLWEEICKTPTEKEAKNLKKSSRPKKSAKNKK